jgi:hypothetical protein
LIYLRRCCGVFLTALHIFFLCLEAVVVADQRGPPTTYFLVDDDSH